MCNIYFFHEQRQLLPSGLCVSNTTNFFFPFYFLWKLNKTFQIREINIPFHNAKWNLNCTKLSGSLVISVLLNRIWKAIGPVLAYRTFLVSTRKFSSHDEETLMFFGLGFFLVFVTTLPMVRFWYWHNGRMRIK